MGTVQLREVVRQIGVALRCSVAAEILLWEPPCKICARYRAGGRLLQSRRRPILVVVPTALRLKLRLPMALSPFCNSDGAVVHVFPPPVEPG